jgi:hypothetical protein
VGEAEVVVVVVVVSSLAVFAESGGSYGNWVASLNYEGEAVGLTAV